MSAAPDTTSCHRTGLPPLPCLDGRPGPMKKLVPGSLAFDANGHPASALHGDIYKSRRGARAEAKHVFLDGCGLPARWSGSNRHTVLEIGFGLGVNFLATLASWRASPPQVANGAPRLDYIGIESHPLARSDLQRALDPTGHRAGDQRELLRAWPDPVPGLHVIAFADGVRLLLGYGCVQDMLPELECQADSIFLDAFTPAKNPVPWSGTGPCARLHERLRSVAGSPPTRRRMLCSARFARTGSRSNGVRGLQASAT